MDDPDSVADIMEKLVKSTEGQTLMSYQIAFDLYENASQQFLLGIQNALKTLAPIPLKEPERQGVFEAKKDTIDKEVKETGIAEG